LSGICESCDRK